MEFYQDLGFRENPFSTFSAEEELGFIEGIFLKPLYLNTLKSDIRKGHSRFILGARGVGKTSLIYQLKSHCDESNIFSAIIDDFEGIKNTKNKSDMLVMMLEVIVRDFSIYLSKNPQAIKNLDFQDKEKLAFITDYFFRTISKSEFEKHYNRVTSYKSKNFFKNIYNRVFNKPINIAVSGSVEIVSDLIRTSFGLPDPNAGKFYKNYLPELEVENPKPKIDSKIKADDKALKLIFEDLCHVINKAGFGKPVIFFDKIDEYPTLSGNITLISGFIEELLKDTTLLLNSNYSLVFSLWDAIKGNLNSKGVRFDKIKPVNVSWSDEQLSQMLEKRLSYFSDVDAINSERILPVSSDRQSIISLASGSPRYLFRLLSVIYDQQNNTNPSVNAFEGTVVQGGMLIYCQSFEFYAVFPGKRGTKDDVMSSVNRLLRVGKIEVLTKDFAAAYKVSAQTATNYVKMQQEYGLIEKTENPDGKAYLYKIKNPIIQFLINNGIKEIAV